MRERVDAEAVIDAVAPLVGLPMQPEWRPGVARFLGLAGEMAAVLDAVPLADDHLVLDAVLVLPELPR